MRTEYLDNPSGDYIGPHLHIPIPTKIRLVGLGLFLGGLKGWVKGNERIGDFKPENVAVHQEHHDGRVDEHGNREGNNVLRILHRDRLIPQKFVQFINGHFYQPIDDYNKERSGNNQSLVDCVLRNYRRAKGSVVLNRT